MPTPPENTGYLFDFLYLDTFRLNSFHAQLVEHGVPVSRKFTDQDKDVSRSRLKAGVPPVLGGYTESQSETTGTEEQHFDATHISTVDTIHELSRQGYVNTGLADVPLGQVILIKGQINIIDIGILSGLWEPISKILASVYPSQKRRKIPTAEKLIPDILSGLPQVPQLRFSGGGEQAWGTLSSAFLIPNPSDMALKEV